MSVGKPYKGFCQAEDCSNKGKELMVRGKTNPRCYSCATKEFQAYGRDKPKVVRHVASGELKLNLELWMKRDHYSQIGGEYLGNVFKPIFASHVLSKGAYPEARLDPENIMFATEAEHLAIHNIARSDLIKKDKKWITYFEYYDKIKNKYDQKRIEAKTKASHLYFQDNKR